MFVESQMNHRLLFHTFGEEILGQELQCPKDWIMQEYSQIDFPFRLLGGVIGYQIGYGGSVPGVLQCQLLAMLAGLELLGGTEIVLRTDFSPFFCVSRWGLHQYLTMHIWIGVVGIVT